jgi:hypothetical protein
MLSINLAVFASTFTLRIKFRFYSVMSINTSANRTLRKMKVSLRYPWTLHPSFRISVGNFLTLLFPYVFGFLHSLMLNRMDQVFLRVLRFTLSVSFRPVSPHSYIIWGMDNEASQWPQFRDIVSPHRHEEQYLQFSKQSCIYYLNIATCFVLLSHHQGSIHVIT